MKKPILILLFVSVLLAGLLPHRAESDTGQVTLRRFALVIGSNDGGKERVKLRYATSDALSFIRVMKELGALAQNDFILLLEPRAAQIKEGFEDLRRITDGMQDKFARKEVVVYYSGHSDEEGLLVSGERINYMDLRKAIAGIDANVRVAILDSCSSGAFTRSKGVIKRPAFLIDESNETKGYAFLTSSAEDEIAQESDKIEGSFFTHYLVSGLRGAADTTRDGLVTLNEAYGYAFRETLARTEKTQYGPQHPKYDMQLTGTGDLVLTDLRVTTCGLILGDELGGRCFIRDESGHLIAEINKLKGSPIELGLPAGNYEITIDREGGLFRANVTLNEKKRLVISEKQMQSVAGETTKPRGDALPGEGAADADLRENDRDETQTRPIGFNLVHFSLIPFMFEFPSGEPYYHFSFGLILAGASAIRGCQVAPIGTYVETEMFGVQVSGIINNTRGDLKGAQGAGIINIAGNDLVGFQGAGIINYVSNEVRYAQGAGIINIGGTLTGIQAAGIGNYLSGNGIGMQASGIWNFAADFSGPQLSSIVNIAHDVSGIQASLVNIAHDVSGIQFGLINIADSYDAGLPIGLINIVSNGVFGFNAWFDSLGDMHIDLRTGTKSMYSIFTGGYDPNSEGKEFTLGAGFGFRTMLNDFFLSFDALACHHDPFFQLIDAAWLRSFEPVARITVGYESGRFGLFAGIAIGLGFPGFYRETDPDAYWEAPLPSGNDTLRLSRRFFLGVQF